MNKIGYYLVFYCLLVPLSLLPMWMLYGISNFISFILQHIFQYRVKVVEKNLKKSFPNKTEEELKIIKNQFYNHLSDVFMEALKMLTISKTNLIKRYYCQNKEVLDKYYKNKQSLIFVSSHHNNWEYMVLSLGMQFEFQGVGVGKRMSNKVFGDLMHKRRTRYGTEVCYSDNVKALIEQKKQEKKPTIFMLLADQSPNDKHKCYWTEFLNQDTPAIFGPENLAKKEGFPVIYYRVSKIRRGYYSFELIPLEDKPQETQYGGITLKYLNELEKTIKQAPPYWLWSHKRWKHKRPENIYQDKFIRK